MSDLLRNWWIIGNFYFKVFTVLITGWIVLQTAPIMDHVMLLMDHVTALLAGPESCVTKKCVPPTALEMANVICKQPSVSVMIPTLVSTIGKKGTHIFIDSTSSHKAVFTVAPHYVHRPVQ